MAAARSLIRFVQTVAPGATSEPMAVSLVVAWRTKATTAEIHIRQWRGHSSCHERIAWPLCLKGAVAGQDESTMVPSMPTISTDLDEFTFRFNRRRSPGSVACFSSDLLQQAVHEPVWLHGPSRGHRSQRWKPNVDTERSGYPVSRKQTLDPKIIDANEQVRSMTDLLRRTLEESIEVKMVGNDDLWRCEVDPAQLENALLNLAINARDAMSGSGKLTIATANVILDDAYAAAQAEVVPGQYVLIEVTDSGTGIPHHEIDKVFDPSGPGKGSRLSMVYGFVKQSRGHLTIERAGENLYGRVPRPLGGIALAGRTNLRWSDVRPFWSSRRSRPSW